MTESNHAYTTTTQGMVEADRWPKLLRDVDEAICDAIADAAIYGHDPKQTYLDRALRILREGYPVAQQLRDSGVNEV